MKKLGSIIKIGLPLLLGVILVWYSLSKISIPELLKYFKKADYAWIVLGVSFGVLSHISRAYRWLFMAEPLGYKPKLANSFMAVYSAYLINFTIPRAGEIARASILTNYEGVPFDKGFGTIVAERVADTIILLLIILFALFLEYDFIYQFFADRFNLTTIVIGGFGLLFLIILGFLFIRKSQTQLAKKIRTFVSGLIEGALSIFKMKKKWAFIFHTIFIWSMYVLMFYVTSFALEELEGISFAAILIGFILASFSIAATNGGIGSFPEAIVIAFLLFSLPEDPSRAFGWIMWSSQTIMIIILGGISLLYLPIYNRKKA
ncbi:lysylphosphatidylglycerol synthase transmembrane domain-containing protein [Winogradskyella immobilis]|uniref:Flippase-like domain-containing protein n=1 Tax=Winogradskyella immobilis TaxID=2816852 RepID=A0ABS8ER29_9FLAO|nr:lysylphosphatidylglycerol synthase transmembrane domain-containing protein [Winogradskyella immobilis]MCC1485302.1 flippase-like domain-containing protein [Winogradskyella immobilis]MCG0017394.1 flippase-like domain-containing protein [Winogradskyella immobilis]